MKNERESFEIIIAETGEIKNIVSFRTTEQEKGFEKKQIRDETIRDLESMTGRNFSFFNVDEVAKYSNCLNDKHLSVFGAVLVLSTYIPMDKSGKLPQTSIMEIANVLGISYRNAGEIIITMEEMNLLYRTNGGFYLNTDIINRGAKDTHTATVKAFHKATRALIGTMRLQHIGFLFLVLPYISFDHNIICKNPNSNSLEDIQGMSLSELGNAVGLNKLTVNRKVKSMTFEYEGYKMSAFAFFTNPVSGKKLIIVNPALFNRAVSNSWKNIINLFIINRC